MSTLIKKVATHLDQQFPQEYDENWVNQLLTDKHEEKPDPVRQSKQREQDAIVLKKAALIDSELRKQRIIRKVKQIDRHKDLNPAPEEKQVKSLSAIEKQKKDYEIRGKLGIDEIPVRTEEEHSAMRKILSRLTKR
jgi:hypothetical protein